MLSRRQAVISSFLALSAGSIGAAAARFLGTDPSPEREDCPGKMTCPLTGELVCKDRCPLGAEGAIEPAAEAAEAAETVGVSACCAKGE